MVEAGFCQRIPPRGATDFTEAVRYTNFDVDCGVKERPWHSWYVGCTGLHSGANGSHLLASQFVHLDGSDELGRNQEAHTVFPSVPSVDQAFDRVKDGLR